LEVSRSPPGIEHGCCKYIGKAVMDSQEGMAVTLRDWRNWGKGVVVENKMFHEVIDLG
jgi:hypothetical protein